MRVNPGNTESRAGFPTRLSVVGASPAARGGVQYRAGEPPGSMSVWRGALAKHEGIIGSRSTGLERVTLYRQTLAVLPCTAPEVILGIQRVPSCPYPRCPGSREGN